MLGPLALEGKPAFCLSVKAASIKFGTGHSARDRYLSYKTSLNLLAILAVVSCRFWVQQKYATPTMSLRGWFARSTVAR